MSLGSEEASKDSIRTIKAEEALSLLKSERALENFRVIGRLSMLNLANSEMSLVDFPVHFSRCDFEWFDSSVVMYEAPVSWDRCTFGRIWLSGVYFMGGLHARDCDFDSPILFDSGGHNQKDAPILFERVRFHGFVDFFDCWFEGPLVFRDVEFCEGSNLLSEERGWVKFEVPPVFENVQGLLDRPLNLTFKDSELVSDDIGPREHARRAAHGTGDLKNGVGE